MTVEEWRDIEGYFGFYQVSTAGRVRSLDRDTELTTRWGGVATRRIKGKLLAPVDNGTGYFSLVLCRDRRKARRYVHHLVATAFIGARPPGEDGENIRHKNGCRSDNQAENLDYCSSKDNNADKLAHGTHQGGENNGMSRITNAEALRGLQLVANGQTQKDAAKAIGISHASMNSMVLGKSWKRLDRSSLTHAVPSLL